MIPLQDLENTYLLQISNSRVAKASGTSKSATESTCLQLATTTTPSTSLDNTNTPCIPLYRTC